MNVFIIYANNTGLSIPYGISKVFRIKDAATRYVMDILQEKEHYKFKPEAELAEIADGYIVPMPIDDDY